MAFFYRTHPCQTSTQSMPPRQPVLLILQVASTLPQGVKSIESHIKLVDKMDIQFDFKSSDLPGCVSGVKYVAIFKHIGICNEIFSLWIFLLLD